MFESCVNRRHAPVLVEMRKEAIADVELLDALQALGEKVIAVVHELTQSPKHTLVLRQARSTFSKTIDIGQKSKSLIP